MIRFISDLHLCESRPATTAAFHAFLQGPARECDSLWILGDLFEYWAGDDDLQHPFNAQIADALRGLTDAGVPTKLIVGNRDFLLGARFTEHTGVVIVEEPTPLQLGDQLALLMHGDTLCTDDHAYVAFRQMVRQAQWQQQFLAQPLEVRRKVAEDLRQKSEMAKQTKDLDIMDVNADAVAQVLRDSPANILIHGHTHRSARHQILVDGRKCERWVLPDWHDAACWLEWNGQALQLRELPQS